MRNNRQQAAGTPMKALCHALSLVLALGLLFCATAAGPGTTQAHAAEAVEASAGQPLDAQASSFTGRGTGATGQTDSLAEGAVTIEVTYSGNSRSGQPASFLLMMDHALEPGGQWEDTIAAEASLGRSFTVKHFLRKAGPYTFEVAMAADSCDWRVTVSQTGAAKVPPGSAISESFRHTGSTATRSFHLKPGTHTLSVTYAGNRDSTGPATFDLYLYDELSSVFFLNENVPRSASGTITKVIDVKQAGWYYFDAQVAAGCTWRASVSDKIDLARFKVTVPDKAWTGKKVTQASFTVDGKRYAVKGNAKVSYRNNTGVGRATMVITGTGELKGKATVSFGITPTKASINRVEAEGKRMLVRWHRVSAAQKASGYEVRYRESGSSAKWSVNRYPAGHSSVYIGGLKSGKTYDVQVRATKKVGSTTYGGAWSTRVVTKRIL